MIVQSKIGIKCIVGDGAHASIKRVDNGVPYLSSKNFKQEGIDLSMLSYISEQDYQKHFKENSKALTKPKTDDLILSIIGSIGAAYLVKEGDRFGISSSVALIRTKEELWPLYLFYYLKTDGVQNFVEAIKSGSAQGFLSLEMIKSIPIQYPPLPTQQSIAYFLSAYDDLIELNNQRIKLLEETALALYKEWFVRMRFPEYKKAKFKKGMPTDWRIEQIGKVIDYHIGGGWGNDNKDNQFSVAGYVIRGTDIPKVRAGQANQDVYRFHKASNMKSRELIEGDIVFETAGGSEGQPLGRTCFITQEMLDAYGDKVMAASFCKQIRTTSIPSLYLYYFLNYLYDTGMIEAYQVQSTGISNYQFEPFLKFQQIILPKDELMQSFHDKAILMQKQIAILGQQNTQLRQIRDRLLPRLISGKLQVKY